MLWTQTQSKARAAAAAAKWLQSCRTLSNPMDCSLPGSSTHGIFQARVLEWGAIAFSKAKAGCYYFHPIFVWCSRLLGNTEFPTWETNSDIGLSRWWSHTHTHKHKHTQAHLPAHSHTEAISRGQSREEGEEPATVSFIFWPHCTACGILVPWPWIEPAHLALKAQNRNHRTSRDVPWEGTSV